MITNQKHLLLILARDLASNLATPMFIVDPDGDLVFYNEAAELILGRKFGVAGELTREQWASMWEPEDEDGSKIPLGELPLAMALKHRRPAFRSFIIHGLDGAKRKISVVANPLLAHEKDFAGATAIFWED